MEDDFPFQFWGDLRVPAVRFHRCKDQRSCHEPPKTNILKVGFEWLFISEFPVGSFLHWLVNQFLVFLGVSS